MNCDTPGCNAIIRCQCILCDNKLCFECLKTHLQDANQHNVQAINDYKCLIDPLDIVFRKIPSSSSFSSAIKETKNTLSSLLRMNYSQYMTFCKRLPLLETSKLLLWEELSYINRINGK